MKLVDLHTHSTCSDGTLSPEALVRLASDVRLDVLALTDHDTTAGLSAFMDACARYGVMGIPGIELSAEAPFTLHILGYNIHPQRGTLAEDLEFVRKRRIERNSLMCRRLNDLGIPLALDDVRKEAGGEVLGRPHFARVLVRMGIVPDIRSAFREYLGDGAPGAVPKVRLSPERCIAAIRSAGGLAVLAHPAQTFLNEPSLQELLIRLKGYGLWGLECVSSHHDSEAIFRFLSLASELDLHPTAGSDFHGGNRPGVDLGLPVSDGFLAPLLLARGDG